MRKLYTAVLRDLIAFINKKCGHCSDGGGIGEGGHCAPAKETHHGHCY